MRANGARSVRRNRRRSRRIATADTRPLSHRDSAARRKAWALAPDACAMLHQRALSRRTPGRSGWMPPDVNFDGAVRIARRGLGNRPTI
jgi:hypothetical protein